ncbi:MAG: hypothetical protein V3S26_06905 [Acidimicrobiia bacterium]|jgi:hypothetical protein
MTISRDDIEAKALELVGAVDDTRRSARDKAILLAVAIGVVVVAAFVFGRKRGSRNKTVVEVYRV